MANFNDIEFGETTAEGERAKNPSLLTEGYYQDTEWPELALNESTFLFLGNKGAGKSSLLSFLSESRSHDRFTNFSDLTTFPFSNFSTAGFTGAIGQEKTLPKSWLWLFVLQFIWSFEKDLSVKHSDIFQKAIELLQTIGFSHSSSMNDIVSQTRSSKHVIHGPSFDISALTGIDSSLTSFKFESNNQGKDLRFDTLIESIKRVLMECRSDNRHLLLIDGLDRALFTEGGNLKPIAALIEEATRLNNEFRESGTPFKIIVVCRKDLFDRLPLYNSNGIKQTYTSEIRWFVNARDYEDNKLVALADFRAKNSLGEEVNIFRDFFSKRINLAIAKIPKNYGTVQYVLWHTRNTPRDFLTALKYIQSAHNPENSIVTTEEIIKGLSNYGHDYFYDEIRDELLGYFDPESIATLFSVFIANGKNRLATTKAVSDLVAAGISNDEAFNMLRILFDCSAIGHIFTNSRGKEITSSKHYRAQARFDPKHDMIIHRGLWKPLNFV